MAEATTNRQQDALPKSGKVNEVCREFGVLEDHALAYRLQNEEITTHYSGNRTRNAIIREDIPTAREQQQREEEEKQRQDYIYRLQLYQQENEDNQIAKKLQQELLRQEQEQLRMLELADRKVAEQIQTSSCQSYSRRTMMEKSGSKPPLPPPKPSTRTSPVQPSPTANALPHEFLRLDEEEIHRKSQEERDEEIARRLQEDECNTSVNVLDKDTLMAIEAQDRELAKMLHDEEKAKLRRARERARQKALLKKQKQASEQQELPEREPSENFQQAPVPGEEESARRRSKQSNRKEKEAEVCQGSQRLNNVAMMIDPTYKRTTPPVEPVLPVPEEEYIEDDDVPVPPYMPIQGQRRNASLEKKKKRREKENCKQQ